MKYSDQFTKAFETFHESPDHAGIFDSPFWSMIVDAACESVRTSGTIDSFIKEHSNFLDYGICKELHAEPEKITLSIENAQVKDSPIPLHSFSKWLSDQINKIKQCDKKDILVKEFRLNQIQLSKLNRDVVAMREQRNAKLLQLTEASSSPNAQSDYNKIIADLESIDLTQLESFRVKKAISKGVFFSVEQKRDNAQRESKLAKSCDSVKNFLDCFPVSETLTEIRQLSLNITDMLHKIVETEQVIEKNQADLQVLEKQQAELSPLELENKIREEIEHIRDLTRLTAKRMHLENCPVLLPEKKYFTYESIIKCLDRILEFDPKIFKNDRVAIYGKPHVILIPGSGNALYDWKNNVIIVPLTYIGENPMSSISAGMIEYRLDADEDKAMLNSYSQLPETKTIKSSIQIKAQLTKDYTTWMTSEYQGYRVLPKSIKEWFEHEIGPNKNEIFIPPAYQPFNFSAAEFNKLIKLIDERIIYKSIENADIQDLWVGSILFYIQGNNQRAYDLLLELLRRNFTNPMVFYNLGQVASKLYMRSNAVKGYSEFISRIPQCWWTRVAGDHLRVLQSTGAA